MTNIQGLEFAAKTAAIAFEAVKAAGHRFFEPEHKAALAKKNRTAAALKRAQNGNGSTPAKAAPKPKKPVVKKLSAYTVDTVMTGVVTTVRENGFGFLKVEGYPDIFFHASNIEDGGPEFFMIDEGDTFTFKVIEGEKGLMAALMAPADSPTETTPVPQANASTPKRANAQKNTPKPCNKCRRPQGRDDRASKESQKTKKKVTREPYKREKAGARKKSELSPEERAAQVAHKERQIRSKGREAFAASADRVKILSSYRKGNKEYAQCSVRSGGKTSTFHCLWSGCEELVTKEGVELRVT